MKRSLSLVAVAAAGVLTAGLAVAPVSGDTAVPTYKEFASTTYQDFDGQYIVNGDEALATNADLKKYYERMVNGPKKTQEDGLIVNTVGGADDKWSASQAMNLTYCVSNNFGTRKADVITAMAAGAGLWEAASSKVNFVYVATQDASCNTRNKTIVFSVEPVSTTQYIARAFFPSYPKRSRNILIDDSIWTSGNWTPDDILGHELGHTLGFRHEHTRPESGTCFEDNNWRALTPYDAASIMHYPQCNGSSSDLEFQPSDAAGVRALYGT